MAVDLADLTKLTGKQLTDALLEQLGGCLDSLEQDDRGQAKAYAQRALSITMQLSERAIANAEDDVG